MLRVAFIGAPDSGKTTLAKIVSAELNLEGYVPAYVHEYARDYVTKYHELPSTVGEQFMLFHKQLERENDMCSQYTQIMYTDSPLMLPYIYSIDMVKTELDRDNLAYLYSVTMATLKNRYDRIFLLRPFRKPLDDGIRDINRTSRLDTQMKAFLDLHGLKYTELISTIIKERITIVKQEILGDILSEGSRFQ